LTESVSSIAQRRFRAGSSFELVVFDRLPAVEQAPLSELRADPDFYGILRPREGSGRTVKAVGKDTALLWLTLTAPGPLPFFVWGDDPEAAAKAVGDLVLDGVLEMEHQGAFVSGAAALSLTAPAEATAAPPGRLAALSLEALRYGQALGLDDPAELAARLYSYGRLPVTAAWARRLPDAEAVLEFLGAAEGSPRRRQLEAGWERAPEGRSPGWIAWRPRLSRETATATSVFKLYLSPLPEAAPAAFAALVEVLTRRGARAMKVGHDAAGLARPDKLVAYFGDLEGLRAVAAELEERLAGVPAQGVPFSAPIDSAGLLSWGMDPPGSERALTWQDPESWRLWVARRLAAALIAAQSQGGTDMEPRQFAVERLRREGVDVDHWTPSTSLWRSA
jgi:hypothetical protein